MTNQITERNYLQEGNSGTNQTIKGKLVEREIYCCVTTEVGYILNKAYEDVNAPYSYDDVENHSIDNTQEIAALNDELDELEVEVEDLDDNIEDLKPRRPGVNPYSPRGRS